MVEELVKKLKRKKETVSTMESCSGGALANAITNISGSSDVFKFAIITYANDFITKYGVDKKVVEKYSVYSIETAKQMAYQSTFFSESTYGIGVTGKFFDLDDTEENQEKSYVYISIYNTKNNLYTNIKMKSPLRRRVKCKEYVIEKTIEKLIEIIDR